jgi:hypothetical protein
MWVIVHLYVGLALGSALHWPFWLVAIIAIGSHVILDLIPHWDYTHSAHPIRYGWFDFLGGLSTLIVCGLVWHTPLSVLAMGPISAAPDFDVLVRTLRAERGRYWFPSHWSSFPHGACGRRAGVSLQLGVVAATAAGFFMAGAR